MVCLLGLTLRLESGDSLIKVRSCQLVVEVQRDVGQPFQGVEKPLVEIGTIDRLDVLGNIRILIVA